MTKGSGLPYFPAAHQLVSEKHSMAGCRARNSISAQAVAPGPGVWAARWIFQSSASSVKTGLNDFLPVSAVSARQLAGQRGQAASDDACWADKSSRLTCMPLASPGTLASWPCIASARTHPPPGWVGLCVHADALETHGAPASLPPRATGAVRACGSPRVPCLPAFPLCTSLWTSSGCRPSSVDLLRWTWKPGPTSVG